MSAADPRLEALAEAITDNTPVDWGAEESASSPENAATIRELKSLALIASVQRRATASRLTRLFHWGHLEVLEKLGEGSFAEVFRAWDTTLGREVALKLRRVSLEAGESARTWLDEGHRMARVRHPHVLVVHGAAVHDGRAGIWTDLISGRTLEDLLQERGAFGAREAALIGIDLCGALAAVHAAGLVHGDLKTRNVMREGEAGASHGSGRIVLMDFGSASEASDSTSHPFGTPLTTAPEVLAGSPPTPLSDLYSLGVLLYRLVTLRYPVEAKTMSELREKWKRDERIPLRSARPDLPAPFVQLVERAMALDPAHRFASAAELERALAAMIPSADSSSRRPKAALMAGVTILVVGAIVAILVGSGAFRSGSSRDPATQSSATSETEVPATGATEGAGVTPQSVATPSAAVARPPQVDVSLERVGDGSREPLRTGDRVDPGDRLSLRLTSSERVYAYVLNEDESGAVYVLYPLRDRGESNPLSAGATHRLPGGQENADLDWLVTSAGGKETFLILVARTALSPVEEALASLPTPRIDAPVNYAPLVPEALGRIRGVGGVARRPAGSDGTGTGGRLHALAQSLSSPEDANDIWIRLIVLENPGTHE